MKRRTLHRTTSSLGLLLALVAAGGCAESSSPSAAATEEPAAAPAPAPAAAPAPGSRRSLAPQEPGAPPVLDVGVDLTKKEPYPGATTQVPEDGAAGADPAAAAVLPEGTVTGIEPPAGLESGPVGPQARMSLVEGQVETADFGEVQQGTKATHVFRLKSDGEADLVISRLKPSCGCTVADVKLVEADDTRSVYTIGQPIPPGREFEIEVSIVTDGRQGPMSTYVAVFSNEPKGYANLYVKADVIPVLLLQPEHTLNLGALTSADRAEGTLKITSTVLEPYALELDPQFVVEPLAAELVPIEPTPEGKATTWELRISLGPNAPEGLRNYPLRLVTDVPVPEPKVHNPASDERPMFEARAFVQAQVTGLVSAEPNFLSFGMVRPGQVVERTVKIVCHDDFALSADVPIVMTGLRGEEFPYRDSFSWELVKLEDGTMDFELTLQGMPEDLNGSFGGVIDIAVAHPHKASLQIRFSGVCRQGLPGTGRPPVPTPPADPPAEAPTGGTPPTDGGGEGHR